MKFVAGDPVSLRETKVTQAGGKPQTLSGGSIGRVCKTYGSGFCCVQFSKRCLRVHEDSLDMATEPAPECSESCFAGC